MEISVANFLPLSPDIHGLVSPASFITGLSVGAVGGFFARRFIDWFMIKYGTRRAEKEKRRLDAYEKILNLVEDFHGNIKLLHYRLANRNPDEEARIVQQAVKEGKDPGNALVNHISPDNRPEILMIDIRKHLARIDDRKLESLLSDWAKALESCRSAQLTLSAVRDQKMPGEKWAEMLQNLESTWNDRSTGRKRSGSI